VDAGVAGGLHGRDRARAEDAVLPDQRPVEIAGDRCDVAGKVSRKGY
jgi:hypothetical protein